MFGPTDRTKCAFYSIPICVSTTKTKILRYWSILSLIKMKCITTSAVVMALALIFDFSVVSQPANLEVFVRERMKERG